MPSAKAANKPGHVTTGNVLEDLGFSAQEIREIELKDDLWGPIRAEIEARKLTQAQLAKFLKIHQPDASLLIRGQIARFSITRLLQFAESLGLAVTFSIVQSPQAAARISMRTAKPHSRPARTTAVRAGQRLAKA